MELAFVNSGFQDPASDWMYSIIDLHDRIIFYLLIILCVVVWFVVKVLVRTISNSANDHLAHLHLTVTRL